MSNIKKAFVGMASAVLLAPVLGACSDSGTDVEINAPILNAVGANLMGKPKPEPDLVERAPLVMPPNPGDLPPPTQGQAHTAGDPQQWPKDPVDQKKLAAEKAKADKERYCRDGNWKESKDIDDFRKNTGEETRCRPDWIDNLLSLGGNSKS